MSEDTMSSIRSDVTELQKEVAKQSVLVSKFDTALDKISEVSLNVSKLLAVHEQRIEAQEETGKKLTNLIDQRHKETHDAIARVEDYAEDIQAGFRQELANNQKEILVEIKSLRGDMNAMAAELKDSNDELRNDLENDFDSKFDEVNSRVSRLERLSWLVIGGATVVGVVAAKLIGILQFNLN
jgi:chromosome segregation ATPase